MFTFLSADMSSLSRMSIATLFIVASFSACEAQRPELPAAMAGAQKVHVVTQPAGAQIVVDGIVLGPGPHDITLNPGPHRFKATKNAHFPAEQRLTISGEPAQVTLHLVKSH